MALDHQHCGNLEEHEEHQWQMTAGYIPRPSYIVTCVGITDEQAHFAKWIQTNVTGDSPLAAWEILLLISHYDNIKAYRKFKEETDADGTV